MRILGRFCLLIFGYSVLEMYSIFLQNPLSLFVMEFASLLKLLNQTDGFGCGFLVFGCFSQVFNMFFLFFLFVVGLKFLHFKGPPASLQYSGDCREKIDRLSPKIVSLDTFDRKKTDCNDGFVKKSELVDGFDREKMISRLKNDSADGLNSQNPSCSNRCRPQCDFHDGRETRREGVAALPEKEAAENNVTEENENDNGVFTDEDQVFDVITLRKMVKKERKRGDCLYIELEKERVAAASAAEETMAMLLRLQTEKSAVQREAKRYRSIMEQKQAYDQEVIQALQWMVVKHEEERKVQEYRLRLCLRKLKEYDDSDIDGFFEGLLDSSAADGEIDEGNIVVYPEMDSEDF